LITTNNTFKAQIQELEEKLSESQKKESFIKSNTSKQINSIKVKIRNSILNKIWKFYNIHEHDFDQIPNKEVEYKEDEMDKDLLANLNKEHLNSLKVITAALNAENHN